MNPANYTTSAWLMEISLRPSNSCKQPGRHPPGQIWHNKLHRIFLIGVLVPVLLFSCSTPLETYVPDPAENLIPTPTGIELLQNAPEPPPTAAAIKIWISPDLPRDASRQVLAAYPFEKSETLEEASLIISTSGDQIIGSWVYLAAVPIYDTRSGITTAELSALWAGEVQPDGFQQILLTEDTGRFFASIWGGFSPDTVVISDPEDLINKAWNEPGSLALLTIDQINPGLKILPLDGADPFVRPFQCETYSLCFHIYAAAGFESAEQVLSENYLTNYDPSDLTILALTGVTALVRDTAAIMEDQGVLYPAGDIGPLLKGADITHISNEVPFAEDCPLPDSNQTSLYFCSSPDYLELLEEVGTDLVELSGDHFGDWGPEAMLYSLELYQEKGWLTYGGGRTLEEGLQPVFMEHNGNRLAFIGCNGKIHDKYATASDTNPGASRCDFEWMIAEIARLKDEGYLVVATMQHEEVDSYGSIAIQQFDFRRLAEAGASIVSGSQAHHPQGFEITSSSLIHYGLGNLFFDQWQLSRYNPSQHQNKDKSFIDFHYFYQGRHISTRFVPLQFIDNARPRLMDQEETDEFMSQVFRVSTFQGRWVYLYPGGYFSNTDSE